MAAYLIASVAIGDGAEAQADYGEYARIGTESLRAYGVELVSMDDAPMTVEGEELPGRILVLKFRDKEHVRSWYASPDYQAALPYRLRAADTRFIVAVDGA